MTAGGFLERMTTGLWRENPGLVQLLGLCPLLAVTSTFVNGLGLGVATLLVLTLSNVLVSATRRWILAEIRVPIYVLIIASLVTCTELIFKAWFPALDRSLGIFIPLIVTNCAIIGRAEAFASRNGPVASVIDGLATGLGFCLTLVALGAVREVIGRGTLLSQAKLMFGEFGESMQLTLVPDHPGFLLAMLPPGAFIALGFLVAGRNWLDARKTGAQPEPTGTTSEEARNAGVVS